MSIFDFHISIGYDKDKLELCKVVYNKYMLILYKLWGRAGTVPRASDS